MIASEKRDMRLAIFKMIVPIMISSILEMLVGFVSMALIGNLGENAISAMGLSTRVRGLIWAVYKGIAIGVQVVIAQAIGARDENRVKDAILQTLGSITILSLTFLGSMLIFPTFWLNIFGASGELLIVAAKLLKIVGFGLPFLGIVIIVSGALQGKGDAFTPMVINGIMNAINVLLGLILVRGAFGIPAMGLYGAGYAMVIAQGIAAIIAIAVLVRKNGIIAHALPIHFFKFTRSILKSVYGTGIPSALESLCWQISSILLIRAILTYGTDAFAAYNLGLQAESLAYMPAAGFQVAATAYIGRFLGASEPERARAYLREITKWAIAVSIVGGGLLVAFPVPLLRIMTDDMHLVQMGVVYLVYCGIAQVPQNVAGVIGGALRGAGYTKLPMFSAMIGLYGVRVPIAMAAAYIFNWSVNVVFLAIALDMGARLILASFFYFKTDIYNHPKIV